MKEFFRKIIFYSSVIVFLYTSFELFTIYRDYKKINDTFDSVIHSVVKQEEDNENPYLSIDWDALLEINDDVIGWVYIKDSQINYPIMQYSNNDYYLTKDINKNYSIGGSIFVDARNEEPFFDDNTVIHGHNMKNGSMFNEIAKYVTTASFREGKTEIEIYLPDNTVSIYQIFSANKISTTSLLYNGEQEDRESYFELATKGNVLASMEVGLNAPTVMLSTCVSSSPTDTTRYTIHGSLIQSAIDLSIYLD